MKDSPDDDVYDTISELVASGNPLGRPILGTPESLSAIDRDKLTGYYQMCIRDSHSAHRHNIHIRFAGQGR